MSTAYIALGSNLGERSTMLRGAIAALGRCAGMRVVAESAVYETEPVGGPAQPQYLNMVVAVETSLAPRELLDRCLAIEADHGRERRERWGARTLDLDLLWFEGVSMDDEALILPHPRMAERAFVLVPLADVAPLLQLGSKSVADLAGRCDQSGLCRLGMLPEAV